MEKLLVLDRFIIERLCEPFSHYTERLCGLNCFVIARMCLIVEGCGLFFHFSQLGNFGFASWMVFLVLLHFRQTYLTEKECLPKSHDGPSRMNPRRIRSVSVGRILVGLFLVLAAITSIPVEFVFTGTLDIIFWIAILGSVFAIYFEACNPLPPGTVSKLRKLLTSLRAPRMATSGVRS